jgi:hypothetical protein
VTLLAFAPQFDRAYAERLAGQAATRLAGA